MDTLFPQCLCRSKRMLEPCSRRRYLETHDPATTARGVRLVRVSIDEMNARLRTCCLLGLAAAVNLPSQTSAGGADSKTEPAIDFFRLELRQRTASSDGLAKVVLAKETFDPRTTAVVVVDMWD